MYASKIEMKFLGPEKKCIDWHRYILVGGLIVLRPRRVGQSGRTNQVENKVNKKKTKKEGRIRKDVDEMRLT